MPTITSQHFSFAYYLSLCLQPVRLAYQPPASSTFLSEQISHQQPASSTLLSEQTSTSHQPPANRTGRTLTISIEEINTAKKLLSILFVSYHISYVLRAIILVKYQPFCNNIFLKHKHHSFF
jgi:hypothetical protein